MFLKKSFILMGLIILFTMSFFTAPPKGWGADTSNISVNATILSSSNCLFRPPKNVTVDFGNLDPLSGLNINLGASLIIRCAGSAPIATFAISDDDGLNETGPNANRMQHTVVATEFIPYSLSFSPTTATIPRNTDQVISISATLNGTDYQNAILGTYTDVITLTIAP